MKTVIRDILSVLLGCSIPEKEDYDLREIGFDSIAFIRFIVAIEEETGEKIDINNLSMENFLTVKLIEEQIRKIIKKTESME